MGSLQVRAVGGFLLSEELGRGAVASVYRACRAEDAGPGAPQFAVKVLEAPGESAGPGALAALRREAALLAGVGHPGLAAVHLTGIDAGCPFAVMDVVPGQTLRRELGAGALPVDRVIGLALDLLGPLAAVHRRGLMHRDVKPENIMIRPDGRAQLIDFGLVGRRTEVVAEAAAGTLLYTAPEQSGTLRRPPDHRSDLYSLGVVLFECLAGSPPFVSGDVTDLLRLHATVQPPDLVTLVPGLPAAVAAIVATLLAKDPDDRYDQADLVAEDLVRALAPGTGFEPLRAAPRWPGPQRHPLRGRDAALAQLRARWERARTGNGGVVVVTGTGGVGKTRLVAELAALARHQGAAVLHGRGNGEQAGEPAVPLGPLRAALRGYLGDAERLPHEGRRVTLQRVADAAGAASSQVMALVPELPRLLGHAAGDPPVVDASVEADDGRDRFESAVADLCLGLAGDGLLLVLDDAQHLDASTHRVVDRLAHDAEGVPLLVVLVTSEADVAARVPGVGRVPLEALPDAAVADLVADALPGTGADHPLTRTVVARSAGNPFVAQEYLQAIVDAGLLAPQDGAWLLDESALEQLDLPQDANGLVLARLTRLAPGTRAVLATAATVGSRFRADLVAAVHHPDGGAVRAALAEAMEHGLVEARNDGWYVFGNLGVRRALLDELPEADAARRHRELAALLEAQPGGRTAEESYAIAHHYLSGGAEHAPRLAFAACWAAGRAALANHADAEAAELLGWAAGLAADLDLSPSPASDPLFGLDHGTALLGAGDYGEAVAVLARTLDHAQDPLTRARILLALANTHRMAWQPGECEAVIRRGLAELGHPLPLNRAALLLSSLGRALVAGVIRTTGRGFGSAAGAERERGLLVLGLHYCLLHLASRCGWVVHVVATSLHQQYWANRIGSGEPYLLSRSGLGFLYLMLGRQRRAQRLFADLNAPDGSADRQQLAMIASAEHLAMYLSGLDDGESLVRLDREHGAQLPLSQFRDTTGVLAMHLLNAGRSREATRVLERMARRLGVTGKGSGSPPHEFILAMMDAVAGRPVEAAARWELTSADLPSACLPGVAAFQWLSKLVLLREQDETGEPFDQAVAAFQALGLGARRLTRVHRVILCHVATGRLARARGAAGAEREERLQVAAAAVAALRPLRRDANLRPLERVARADLLLQRGDARAALRALAEITDTDHHDLPIAEYEGARVRARALAALDAHDEALRQARVALHTAEDEGWPHRAAWVVAEFGPQVRDGRGSGSARSSKTSSAGATDAPVTDSLTGASSVRHPARSVNAVVELERMRLRLQAYEQVSLAASRVVEPAALARICLSRILAILSAERAYLFLVDDEGLLAPFLGRTAAGDDVAELTGYSASLVQRVHTEGEPLVVTGTDEGEALGARSVVLHGLRSILIAPVLLEQRRIGVVYLDSQIAKGIFTTDDVDILTALTTHIATALETARAAQLAISVRTAEHERDLADRLRRASADMAAATSPDAVLERLLDWAGRLAPCDAAWLAVRRPQGLHLLSAAPSGRDALPAGEVVEALLAEPLPDDPGLAALLAATEPVADPPASLPGPLRERMGGAAWLAVPLPAGELDGGVLVLRSTHLQPADDAGVVSALVAQAGAAYDRAVLFARVQSLAVVDELTGLSNRRHFFELARWGIQTSRQLDRPMAALMLDIDHFKQINDTYGHATGDDVIRIIGERLAGHVREADLVGRYGGEEFAVLLADSAPPYDLPERLRQAISTHPVVTRSGLLHVTVSVGVAELRPDDDLDGLLARADQAMYRAKQGGRDRVVVAA